MPPKLVPAPASIEALEGADFAVAGETLITVDGSASQPVGEYLATLMRPPTGYPLPVTNGAMQPESTPGISLSLESFSDDVLGPEGYRLHVDGAGINLVAAAPQGLFWGIQTLRQLLPPRIESKTITSGPWIVPGVRIIDRPRWGWRGSMLDVARHFFSVADVKRHIDLTCLYKLNVLHLHLTDDQGWRIHIDSWPRLTQYGGRLQVGGTKGGYFTKDEYREIVSYAAARHMTIVPEIDMPGHTQAALASYPELTCDERPGSLYTGTNVGFSSLCVDKEVANRFVTQVITEMADLTSGPFLHIGGDEAAQTSLPDYVDFIKRVEETVGRRNKTMVGWEEITKARPARGSIVQFWNNGSGSQSGIELARAAVASGSKLVMSPSERAYLDMKYDSATELGTRWAGFIDVRRAYEWDPADYVSGVDESDILGVEAPIWTETIANAADLEYMVWPRLAGTAELGWSPSGRSWDEYRTRLAAQGPRWEELGIRYFRSPQVQWQTSG